MFITQIYVLLGFFFYGSRVFVFCGSGFFFYGSEDFYYYYYYCDFSDVGGALSDFDFFLQWKSQHLIIYFYFYSPSA